MNVSTEGWNIILSNYQPKFVHSWLWFLRFRPHSLALTSTHHIMLPSLSFSALWNSHFVQFVICARSMNYASLYFYLPVLHLLTSFLTLLPPSSVGRRSCDKIQFPTPLFDFTLIQQLLLFSFFLTFFSASIILSGYLMIPQVKANRVSDGYTSEAKVSVLMCFLLQPGEKPLWNQAWVVCFIPNLQSDIGVSEAGDLYLSWRGFCSLCLESRSPEFTPLSEMERQWIFVHWSFCLVADCLDGVSGPGKAQEGSIPAGSGWLWVSFLH